METPERYFYDKNGLYSPPFVQWYYKKPNGRTIQHRIDGPQEIRLLGESHYAYHFMVDNKLLLSCYYHKNDKRYSLNIHLTSPSS
jgi:hypothetical protein